MHNQPLRTRYTSNFAAQLGIIRNEGDEMIVNDILDFIRFLKEQKKENKEINNQYFNDYIEPLWNKFKEIHQDYKSTFKVYSEKILSGKDIEQIIDDIKRDSLYSDDLRSELYSMANNLPEAFPESSFELLDRFLLSLSFYFEAKSYFKIEKDKETRLLAPRLSNAARFKVALIIYNNNKDEARQLLDETMNILQSNYKWISDNYYALKKHFKNKNV